MASHKRRYLSRLIKDRREAWLSLQPYFGLLLENPLYEHYLNQGPENPTEVGRTIPIPAKSRPVFPPNIYDAIFEADQLQKSISHAKDVLDEYAIDGDSLVKGYIIEHPIGRNISRELKNILDENEAMTQKRNAEEYARQMHARAEDMTYAKTVQLEIRSAKVEEIEPEFVLDTELTFEDMKARMSNMDDGLVRDVYERYLAKKNDEEARKNDILPYNDARKLMPKLDEDLAKIAYLRYKTARQRFNRLALKNTDDVD